MASETSAWKLRSGTDRRQLCIAWAGLIICTLPNVFRPARAQSRQRTSDALPTNTREIERIIRQAEALGIERNLLLSIRATGRVYPEDLANITFQALVKQPQSEETQALASLAGNLLAEQTTRSRDGNQVAPGEPLPAEVPPSFSQLKAEYGGRFRAVNSQYISFHKTKPADHEIIRTISKAVALITSPTAKDQYIAVSQEIGIPWYVVAILHYREANLNFMAHIHNGDPIFAKTFHVPAGRPRGTWPPVDATGTPITHPLTLWQLSTIDALKPYQIGSKWSVERICYLFESYNGFGYRKHGVASPYLWNFTQFYNHPPAHPAGGFPADGKWSASYISRQIGAVTLLRALLSEPSNKIVPEYENVP